MKYLFKIFKNHIKWKLISMIKDKLMQYSSPREAYNAAFDYTLNNLIWKH